MDNMTRVTAGVKTCITKLELVFK